MDTRLDAGLSVREVQVRDMPRVADIFARSFTSSIRHYCGTRVPDPVAFIDLFRFVSRAEQRGFLVAEAGGPLIGYVVALASPGSLVRAALTSPYMLRAIGCLLSGTYRVSWSSMVKLLRDKVRMGLCPTMLNYRGGEILSVAVAPDFRRQGVGRRLLEAGIDRLRQQGVRRVRLEVRPENKPALRLYRTLGFANTGVIADSQGPWLIMIREITRC